MQRAPDGARRVPAALGNSMQQDSPETQSEAIAAVYRSESRRVFATLVRLLGDFDLAEEALQEAFAAAVDQWGRQGIPANPRAWLVSAGRFRAIDALRRRQRLDRALSELVQRHDGVSSANLLKADSDIEDDRLRLIFTCCHPAIAPEVQIALTLREVCGLTTEETASAFLTSPTTMAQRLVRGKAKIRHAGIPYQIPSLTELPARLDSVLSVIYLLFSEGYAATAGDSLTRPDLSAESIRLCRLVLELLPDPEVRGLLALLLLHESRRTARCTPDGTLILLEHQDRTLWNQGLIDEGRTLVAQALAAQSIGAYTIQAAIALVHAEARQPDETNWEHIVGWYDLLLQALPSPVVELNRAVAVAMCRGAAAGLQLVDDILQRGHLQDYHLAHAARADLYRRLQRPAEARDAYAEALRLARQEPERRFLQSRLDELAGAADRQHPR